MSTTSQRTNPRKLEKSGHCSAWKDGFCFQGNKCLYIHDIRVLDETREIRLTMLAAAQKEGLRRREEAEREVRERLLRNLRIQLAKEETSKTVQHVVLGSAMVSYGAGASVQHVLPGCNSCRIGVANLPLDATREEVEGLFTQQGIVPGTFCLLGLAKAPDGKHLEADVVIDKENGQMISIGLDGIEFRDELLGFEVSENDRPDGMQASATRGSDIITFSLRAPSSSMLVSFLSQAQAQERAQQLNRQMCAGRRVRVETNRYISGDPYFGETAVRITGLPLNVPLVKVTMFAGAGLLKVLNPVNYDVQEAFKLLRLSIEAIPGGRLEKYEIISGESVEGILLVKAHLGTWEHARKVHALLDDIRLPYLGGTSLKMRLPDPILYTLSVPLRQHEAQKRAWDSLTDAGNNSQACSIRIHLNDKAFIRVLEKTGRQSGR
ncbi:hypothetical protein B0H10DRAFT_1959509 [Mycena sp. CBHHK59/15]|nr:hypothetical protein B0H10DRAFT_1959509 [Mycena sp. CBHHK59/15]